MVLSEQTKGYVATIAVILIVDLSFLFVKKALIYSDMWDVLTLLLIASLYPVLIFIFQIWGLKYITSAEAGIIQAVQPLLTMGMAAILYYIYPATTFRIPIYSYFQENVNLAIR